MATDKSLHDSACPFLGEDHVGFNRRVQVDIARKVGKQGLRHSFASVLVKKGTPIYQVSKLLGHSSVRVTERYAHLYAEDGGKYVDQINIGGGCR